MKSSEVGSPEIEAPSSVIFWMFPQKYGDQVYHLVLLVLDLVFWGVPDPVITDARRECLCVCIHNLDMVAKHLSCDAAHAFHVVTNHIDCFSCASLGSPPSLTSFGCRVNILKGEYYLKEVEFEI